MGNLSVIIALKSTAASGLLKIFSENLDEFCDGTEMIIQQKQGQTGIKGFDGHKNAKNDKLLEKNSFTRTQHKNF